MSIIPPHAKKVFSGIIFDVHQWEQQMYDGSTATFEKLSRPNTVNVIAVNGETIYLAKQEQPDKGPFLSFLGGRQDPGETPEETAKRELLEEAGMTATRWEQYSRTQPYTKIDWTIYTFIAKDCTQVQPQQLDAGEKIDVLPVSFDELLTLANENTLCEHEFIMQALRMQLFPDELAAFKKKLFS